MIYNTIMYDNMPKIILNNQIGNIVFLRCPNPNSRIVPSLLYKNPGCEQFSNKNDSKNMIIDTLLIFFLTKPRVIYTTLSENKNEK